MRGAVDGDRRRESLTLTEAGRNLCRQIEHRALDFDATLRAAADAALLKDGLMDALTAKINKARADDLEHRTEIEKKRKAGYPLNNIIFEAATPDQIGVGAKAPSIARRARNRINGRARTISRKSSLRS